MESCSGKRHMPKWAENLLIWCCPAFTLILVFLCIPNSLTIRKKVIVFCLILLFGLIITRLIFLFRSCRAVGAKIWRCTVWAILLIILFFFGLFCLSLGEHHRSTAKDAQRQFETSVEEILPDAISVPLDLGSPKSVVLHEYLDFWVIFHTRSYTLLCQYGDAEYHAAKTALESRYGFRTELMDNRYHDNPDKQQFEPYVEIGDDHFRFLYPNDADDQTWEFYKRSILVVTNDVAHEIGYILFDDIDLDYVNDLTEFINVYCGWKYVRS
jgi:hypothetical protein